MKRLVLAATALTMLGTARSALAADWTPRAWANESTLELRTTAAGEGEHWFPVWLVVIDDQIYVRLGSRAAGRIEGNTTAPYVGARVGGREFERVKGVPAPDYVDRVAKGMADKYWSDVLIHYFSHPMTLRLEPAPAADEQR
jgi:hypothetical protein